jgi:hypothetical protein
MPRMLMLHFSTRAVALAAGAAVISLASPARATTGSVNIDNDMREESASVGARDLLVRVDEALNAMTYTEHRLSDQAWSDDRGVYKVDCSGYVNRMVEDAVPEAYDELRDARDRSRPLAVDYYYFFRTITIGGTKGRWRRPARVSYLRPGDVVAVKYDELSETGTTGHMMIVVGVPERDTRWSNVWKVRVTDSAKSGHTSDSRGTGDTGVGVGTILIQADSSGQPVRYAWSLKAYWKSDNRLALGRPRY